VLDTVGMKWPETRRRALWSLILRRAGIRLRGLWFRERHPTQISPQDLIRIDTCGSVAVGLSMVDPIRAADFQARCLLLSLRCGEPYQIVRALALEAGHAAVGGGPARHRVAQLLKKAHILAHRVSNPRARGEVALAAGIAACMQGRWKRAVRLCDRAEKVFREHGTGVAWEVDTARGWAAEALQHSGQIVELARRLPSLRAEARRRGNLYALSSLGCDKTLPELAADDPEAAEQNVRESMAPWPKTEFHVQHLDELYALVQIDLYRGRGDVAWRRIRERWPALARSLLLRVQMVRGLMYHTSARCALAAALSTDHPRPLLRAAGQAARRLEREKQPWMEPLAGLVRATIAASGGDTSRAVKLLTHAITRFDAVDMALYAAAARRRLGEILGGDEGAALCAAAHWWMAGQNVVDPARMAALCAPGFPPCKAPL
jgi:hypothetical protein